MALQQQINLYQPRFRKQEKVFAASSMLIVLIAAMVVLTSIYGYAKWNVYALAKESQRLQQQHDQSLAKVGSLAKKYPVKRKSLKITTQLKELQGEHKAKQYLVKTLSGRSIGNSDGFSAYFEGIARQHLPGMWVKRLELDNGGDVVGIHGSTLKPELVPQFIQALSEEDSFAGSSFQIFSMQRDDKDAAAINFSLRTVANGDRQ